MFIPGVGPRAMGRCYYRWKIRRLLWKNRWKLSNVYNTMYDTDEFTKRGIQIHVLRTLTLVSHMKNIQNFMDHFSGNFDNKTSVYLVDFENWKKFLSGNKNQNTLLSAFLQIYYICIDILSENVWVFAKKFWKNIYTVLYHFYEFFSQNKNNSKGYSVIHTSEVLTHIIYSNLNGLLRNESYDIIKRSSKG